MTNYDFLGNINAPRKKLSIKKKIRYLKVAKTRKTKEGKGRQTHTRTHGYTTSEHLTSNFLKIWKISERINYWGKNQYTNYEIHPQNVTCVPQQGQNLQKKEGGFDIPIYVRL